MCEICLFITMRSDATQATDEPVTQWKMKPEVVARRNYRYAEAASDASTSQGARRNAP
jgi:hypothetical protein